VSGAQDPPPRRRDQRCTRAWWIGCFTASWCSVDRDRGHRERSPVAGEPRAWRRRRRHAERLRDES